MLAGVIRSYPESSRVVWSRLEFESFGVVRSTRSRPEATGAVRCNVLLITHFITLCFLSLCTSYLFRRPTPVDSGRLQIRKSSIPSVSRRLQTTLNDSDSGRLRSTPNNVGQTYLAESVPKFSELDRSHLRIFANFTHH